MMWLSSWRWKRSICIIYMLCLTDFMSITSNWSWQSVNSFKSEVNCLGHHVLKDGVRPSQDNLKVFTECTLPQTYTDIQAFYGLGRSLQRVHQRICTYSLTLHEYLSGDGAGKKSEPVTLMEEVLHAFKTERNVSPPLCWHSLTSRDHSCLQLIHWKKDLELCFCRKKWMVTINQ